MRAPVAAATSVGVALLAVLAPLVLPSGSLRSVTVWVLLATAAAGLAVTVRGAGVPSLAHGAFVGLGVYVAAIGRQRYGLDPVVVVVVALAVGLLAGRLLAAGVASLRPAFTALVTWLLGWALATVVADLPGLTGGTRGIVLGAARTEVPALGLAATIGPRGWWWTSLAVAALSLGALLALRRRYGAAFRLVRSDPAAALASGVPVARVRAAAITLPAALATVAGAVLAQVEGVADPARASVLLSVQLFVVVLFGGTVGPAGAVVGLAVLSALEWLVGAAGAATALATTQVARTAPAVASLAVLGLVAALPDGLVPVIRRRRRTTRPHPEPTGAAEVASPPPEPEARTGAGVARDEVVLRARGLVLELGPTRALDGVDLEVHAGRCLGVLGPNGSGKTVLLRVLSGALDPDAGTVELPDASDGARRWRSRRLGSTGSAATRRQGVARAPQRLVDAGDLTPRELVTATAEATRPRWSLPAIVSTPLARAERRHVDHEVGALLSALGLATGADVPLARLDVTRRRLAQLAAAAVGRPAVVLLDEPAAGVDEPGVAAIARGVAALVAGGAAVVVVEHDRRVLRQVADHVVGLVSGQVVVRGTLDDVLADPAIAATWTGERTDRVASSPA